MQVPVFQDTDLWPSYTGPEILQAAKLGLGPTALEAAAVATQAPDPWVEAPWGEITDGIVIEPDFGSYSEQPEEPVWFTPAEDAQAQPIRRQP